MKPLPPCVFPSLTEEEIVTVPGQEPGTAYRLRVEPGMHGYLRIEQLGYNTNLGWYMQKSFCLPGEVAHQLLPHLRKAAALIPRPLPRSDRPGDEPLSLTDASSMADHGPLRFPGPSADTQPPAELRREA